MLRNRVDAVFMHSGVKVAVVGICHSHSLRPLDVGDRAFQIIDGPSGAVECQLVLFPSWTHSVSAGEIVSANDDYLRGANSDRKSI